MAEEMEGIVTIVQEGRFHLTDDAGRGHLVILAHNAAAETDQLAPLARRQARVRISYTRPAHLLALVAHRVAVCG